MEQDSSPLYSLDTVTRVHAFELCVAQLAERHQLYLQDDGRRLADCYTLEVAEGNARLEVHTDVPFDLHDELRACFGKCFG